MEAVYCKERLHYQTVKGGAKELVPYACLKGDCGNLNCGWDHKEPQEAGAEEGGDDGEELKEGMLPSFCQCSIENDPEANITYRVYREEIQEQSVSGAYRGDVEEESSNEKREGAKNLVIRAITTSRTDFLKYLKDTMKKFVVHAYDAKWQADEFQRCKDGLGPEDICIVIDFAMNYGHAHQDAVQSEHWSKHQSTVAPVAIWYRDKDGNLVMEAIIFISEDTKHSNKFVQYVLEKVIKSYQEKLWGECNERELKRVHVWSDGCAGQFKNRNQLYWLVRIINSLSFKAAVSGPYVSHNFFASCHGKGPSDALAAIIKTALSRAEKFGTYFPDTDSLLPWLNANMATSKEAAGGGEEEEVEGGEEAKEVEKKKKKGNIASLSFVHVKLNEVRIMHRSSRYYGWQTILSLLIFVSIMHRLMTPFPCLSLACLYVYLLRSTMPSMRQSVKWRVLSHFIPLFP